MGLAGQGGGISSAFQFNLQPKYSGGIGWEEEDEDEGEATGVRVVHLVALLPNCVDLLRRTSPAHAPLLPRAGFPGRPHSPPLQQPLWILPRISPGKGLHGGHSVKKKQTKKTSSSRRAA